MTHLRSSLLDLAVRGRLGTGDPNNKPCDIGPDLAEAQRALRVGHPRHESQLKTSWITQPLRHLLTNLQTGPFGSSLHRSDYVEGGTPVINPASIVGRRIVPSLKMAVGTETVERLASFKLRRGDIVLARRGEMGRCAVVTSVEDGWLCGTGSLILRFPPTISADFMALISSPGVRTYLGGSAVGATMQNLNQLILLNLQVGLPPLAEQHRIVAKVDQLMALCDELEAAQTERESRRDRLRTTALRNLGAIDCSSKDSARFFLRHSRRMITNPEHVTGVRQAILDLAVQGRLVPQDSGDEPFMASRCRSTEQMALHRGWTPVGWSVETLRDLAPTVTSGSRGWAKFYSDHGALFVRSQNIKYGHLLLEDRAYVSPPPRSEGTRTSITVGDLLVVITGDVGHVAVWDRDLGEAYVSQHVALVKPLAPELSPWLLLCLMAPTAGRRQLRSSIYGGKPGLNLNQVRSVSIPLPPLAEQRRISAKVDELMAVCDELEHSLAAQQTARTRLLEALLHGALKDGCKAQPATLADVEGQTRLRA
jgi:type I restriction enzyme S subunit